MLSEVPEGLNKKARTVWTSVVDAYDLEEWQLALLEQACRTITDVDKAQRVIDATGPTYIDRFEQPKMIPEVELVMKGTRLVQDIFQKLYLEPTDPEDLV